MCQTGLNMFKNNSPTDRCDQILCLIKNSNLNFSAQETPFTLHVTVRKKFVTRWNPEKLTKLGDNFVPVISPETMSQKSSVSELEDYNLMEEKLQAALKKVEALQGDLEKVEKYNLKTEMQLKTILNDHKALHTKHEKTCNSS